MPASSGDEADSRTASLGFQRHRENTLAPNSHDGDSRPRHKRKKRPRNRRPKNNVNDVVPKGASFSAQTLRVDPDQTSSSGSSSKASDSSKESDASGRAASNNPHMGSTAPAISWNQGRKNAVRTSLGKRKAEPQSDGNVAKQFKAVNGAYWRSRSASVSSGASEMVAGDMAENRRKVLEEGEVDSRSDSDDSISHNSEADDSIMLNIGSKKDSPTDDYDPESLDMGHAPTNGHTQGLSNGSVSTHSTNVQTGHRETKEEAFERFSRKYPTAPIALVDLDRTDFEAVAKYLHWDCELNEIDLQLPVGCIECRGLGHLAAVCPSKECIHCGAWNLHPSMLCPTWRRCPRCRERGHIETQCSSRLKGSASEVPCDLCGSQNHVETQCERQWKLPIAEIPVNPNISVSLSCARCLSSKHLIGDCPSLPHPLNTSSFTLQGIDTQTINNTNIESNGRPALPGARSAPPNRAPRGRNRRGGNIRSPSPDSDDNDMLPRGGRKPAPLPPRGRGRGAARGAIRFGNGVPTRGPDPPRGNLPPKPPPPPRGGGGNGNRGRGRGSKSRRAK